MSDRLLSCCSIVVWNLLNSILLSFHACFTNIWDEHLKALSLAALKLEQKIKKKFKKTNVCKISKAKIWLKISCYVWEWDFIMIVDFMACNLSLCRQMNELKGTSTIFCFEMP